MELKISVSGKKPIDRILTLLELGILTALENNKMKIYEAEGYLFNPYTVGLLENLGVNDQVVEIIKHGCELEDVESLIPQKLEETIQRLKGLTLGMLEVIPVPEHPIKKIIKK